MKFGFSEDQQLFRSTLRELLDEHSTGEHVREAWQGDGRIPGLWEQLAGMGIVGLTAGEQHGGMGMDELDLVLLLEESGRAALSEPLVETTAVALPLLAELGDDDLLSRWAPAAAGGEAILTAALGPERHAGFAEQADLVLVTRGDAVYALEAGAFTATPQPSIDGGRRRASISWDAEDLTPVATGQTAAAAIARAVDRGALAVASQALGLAARMIEMGADYAQQREQFGKPIGTFQAVKHLLADALVDLEFAKPVVYRAAYSVARDAADRSRDVSMAKVLGCEAALSAAKTALQVHGAIGYTEEHDLHLWMKRAWGLASAWGDVAWHTDRVADAVLPA